MKSPSAPAAKPEGKSSKTPAANTNTPAAPSSSGTTNSSSTTSTASQPSHDEIAKLACKIYQESGCVEGRDAENWLKAEQTLRQKSAGKSTSTSA